MSACLPLTREAASREILPATVTVTTKADLPAVQANNDRRSVLIVNTDKVTSAHLVKGRQGSIGDNSYELLPGEGVTLTTAAPVYIVAATGSVIIKTVSELGSV